MEGLEALERRLADQQCALNEQSAEVANRMADIEAVERRVTAREAALADQDKQIADRTKGLQALERRLGERERAINDRLCEHERREERRLEDTARPMVPPAGGPREGGMTEAGRLREAFLLARSRLGLPPITGRYTYDADGNRIRRDPGADLPHDRQGLPDPPPRTDRRDLPRQESRRDFPRDDTNTSGRNPLGRLATASTPTTGGIATPTYSSDQPTRLRAADVMLYDPEGVDVAAFVSRLEFMATLEGEAAVLRVLPLCLKGRALEWHNGLSPECQSDMAMSLAVAIDELRGEFQLSEGEAWDQAQELQFSFEKVAELPLTTYITRKINLLRAAGISDQAMMKRLLWEGLESGLAMITPLVPTERLDDFRRRIRDNEPAARRAWVDRRQQFLEYGRARYRAENRSLTFRQRDRQAEPIAQPTTRAWQQRDRQTDTAARPWQQRQPDAVPRVAGAGKADPTALPKPVKDQPTARPAPSAGCF
ncbi:hypothetical protein GX51_08334, partial [Blastomyces parvus]